MKRMISNLNNEEGSAIVIALIILVLLTMIGITATDNTVIELQIVRNEAIYRQNFYRAESAVVEAAQILEVSSATDSLPSSTSYNWLKDVADANSDMTLLVNWKDNADPPNWPFINTASSNNMDVAADLRNNTRYAAVCSGVAGGASLDMTATNLYGYSVYGLFDSTSGQGRSLIMMGYGKRF